MLKRFSILATISCAVLLAGGCVSRSEFSRVSSERDRVSSELADSQFQLNVAGNESDRLNEELQDSIQQTNVLASRIDKTQAQLTQAQAEQSATQKNLSATRQELSQTQKASGELAIKLTDSQRQVSESVARNQNLTADLTKLREQNRIQSAEAAAQIAEIKATLVVAKKDQAELLTVRESLAHSEQAATEVRTKLAAAEKSALDLTHNRDAIAADLTKARDQNRIQSADAAARLTQAQSALTAAQKDQTELKALRLKLSKAEAASAETTAKLTQSQKRIAELETKLVTLTAQARKSEQPKPLTDITASLDSSKQ